MNAKIAMIMGSDSDFPTVEKSLKLLNELKVEYRVEVSSAHRTPERTVQLIREFEEWGAAVILAVAGGAAHLPGVVASHTNIPVLGVPVQSALSGIDSLYSIVQMPGGIPVASFGIGSSGAVNAVLFALQIMGLSLPEVKGKCVDYRRRQAEKVGEKSRRLQDKIDSL